MYIQETFERICVVIEAQGEVPCGIKACKAEVQMHEDLRKSPHPNGQYIAIGGLVGTIHDGPTIVYTKSGKCYSLSC